MATPPQTWCGVCIKGMCMHRKKKESVGGRKKTTIVYTVTGLKGHCRYWSVRFWNLVIPAAWPPLIGFHSFLKRCLWHILVLIAGCARNNNCLPFCLSTWLNTWPCLPSEISFQWQLQRGRPCFVWAVLLCQYVRQPFNMWHSFLAWWHSGRSFVGWISGYHITVRVNAAWVGGKKEQSKSPKWGALLVVS